MTMNTIATVEGRGSRVESQTPGGAAAFAEARELQWVWKTPAMAAMAVAVCRLASEKAGEEFSANDLTLRSATIQGGSGIAGSIFKRLVEDDVITPVGGFDAAGKFLPKYVTNAGGNPIRVWRLKNYASALRLVELHSGATTPKFTQATLPV
jgi:hypothetical protein